MGSDLDQIVGLERVAGGHQIDDGISHAGQRRQPHGAVGAGPCPRARPSGSSCGQSRVLGGNAQTRALA